MYEDIKTLRAIGYEVEKCSPWHFKILNGTTTLNIWPSKKKCMLGYGAGGAYKYENLIDEARRVVGEPTKFIRKKHFFTKPTDEMKRASDWLKQNRDPIIEKIQQTIYNKRSSV